VIGIFSHHSILQVIALIYMSPKLWHRNCEPRSQAIITLTHEYSTILLRPEHRCIRMRQIIAQLWPRHFATMRNVSSTSYIILYMLAEWSDCKGHLMPPTLQTRMRLSRNRTFYNMLCNLDALTIYSADRIRENHPFTHGAPTESAGGQRYCYSNTY